MLLDVLPALTNLNSSRNRYLFDDRLVNGRVPANDGRCIRCAVVGNGGILNGSKQGSAIDGNDYIFRWVIDIFDSHPPPLTPWFLLCGFLLPFEIVF